jgi:hypothetical protein
VSIKEADMTGAANALSEQDERDLVSELGQLVVAHTAPEELALFDDTSAEYFADPKAALTADRRDEPVGFGLELALLTPYILAVARPVIEMLGQLVLDAVKDESKPAISALVRRLFRRPQAGSPGESDSVAGQALTIEQAQRVRGVALAEAQALGLSDDRATVLADAVAGSLLVST